MSKGLLTFAGMVSGAGQAAEKGLGTIQTGLVQSSLQQERDKLERARLELTEGFAVAREQRGYAHQEAMQGQSLKHAETLQAQNQAFTHGENELTRTHDLTKQERGFTHESGEKDKDRSQAKTIAEMARSSQETIAREGHASTERVAKDNRESTERMAGAKLEVDKQHYKSVEDVAYAQLKAHKDEVTLQPQADGTFARVTRDGRVLGVAVDPETKQPLKGGKDLPAATKVLAEVNVTMIKGKQKELENQTLLPEERQKLQSEVDKLKQDTEILLGRTPAAKPTIVDPDAPGDKPVKTGTAERDMTDDEAEAHAKEGDAHTKVTMAQEQAARHRGLINTPPDTLFMRGVKAVVNETKRQLSPSTTREKPTLQNIEDFIKFQSDPKFVEAYIKRFGSAPTEADYEALQLSKKRGR